MTHLSTTLSLKVDKRHRKSGWTNT